MTRRATKVIGLTGSFGSGKTTVASIFRSLGAKVLDADSIAHSVIQKGQPCYKAIVRIFGRGILNARRDIDHRKLASIVFRDKKLLGKLNGIVHPAVIAHIKKEIARVSGRTVIVIDAPLLVEAHCLGLVDRLVVVKASKANQVARCVKRFGMKRAEVLRRIRNQAPLIYKIKMADFVINNDGALSKTKEQARMVWRKMVWK